MVRELTAGRRLENASVGKGGIRVREDGSIRSETFDGNLILGYAGTAGWALGADRLALRGQFVNPIDPDGEFGQDSGFNLTSTPVEYAPIVIPVPEWADRAIVFSGHYAQAQNSSGVIAVMSIVPIVNDGVGPTGQFSAPDGDFASGSIQNFTIKASTGTLGSAVTVSTRLNTTGASWTSTPTNYVTTQAMVLFTRV